MTTPPVEDNEPVEAEFNVLEQSMGNMGLPVPLTLKAVEPAELIRLEDLGPNDQQKAQKLAEGMDFNNSALILVYGQQPQREMNDYLDTLLQGITAEDADVAGRMAIQLAKGIDMIEVDKFKKSLSSPQGKKFLGIFTLVRSLVDQIRVLQAKKKQISELLEEIEKIGEERQAELLAYINKMDALRDRTVVQVAELKPWIAGGQLALMRGHEELEIMKREYSESEYKDPQKAQAIRQFSDQLTAFDVRVIQLKMAFVDNAATAPLQIMTIKAAAEIEQQNVANRLLFDMQRFRMAVLNVAALATTKSAQDYGEDVKNAETRLQQVTAQMAHDAYIKARETQGDALERVQQMSQIADSLIATLEEGKTVQEQTAQKRREAEHMLVDIRDKVTHALQDV